MAQSAATNLIDLAQYREQRTRKSMRSRPSPYMMCWVMFVPMMMPQAPLALRA